VALGAFRQTCGQRGGIEDFDFSIGVLVAEVAALPLFGELFFSSIVKRCQWLRCGE
jgi:hypothetical protein